MLRIARANRRHHGANRAAAKDHNWLDDPISSSRADVRLGRGSDAPRTDPATNFRRDVVLPELREGT
jgi:hypothetical protein